MNTDVENLSCKQTFVEDDHSKTKISSESQQLHTRNKYGHTPLMIAIKSKNLEQVIQIIIKDTTTLLDKTENGSTVLMHAVQSKNQAILKALLSQMLKLEHKDIAELHNATDIKGRTYVMYWMKSEQTADAELQGLFDRVLQIAISGQESADRDALTTATPLLLSRKSRNTSLKVTFTTKVEIRFYNKDEPAKTTETEILKDMKTSSNHKLAEVPQGRKKRKCG